MFTTKHTPSGFSLLEIMVALGLFTFCIVGLLNLLTVGIQATGQTEQRLEAANTAQTLLEMRRLYPKNPSGVDLSEWGLAEIAPPLAETVVISEEGKRVLDTSDAAAYRLTYRYALPVISSAMTNTKCVNVYLSLAPFHPAGKLRAYEIVSSITLP